jgi:hypothetical protein
VRRDRSLMFRRSRFVFLVCTCVYGVATQPPVAAQAQSAPKPEAKSYSQESVVVEDLKVEVRFENDGQGTVERSVREKIQAESGVRSEGLLVFSYLAGDESLEIQYVHVRKPDGTVIETPLDSAQDVTSEVARAAPMYTSQHEKHVAVKGLAVGDTLEFSSVTKLLVPLVPGQFWYSQYFLKEAIVIREQVEISVPKNRPVKLHSPHVQPAVTEEGDRRIYTFASSHLQKEPDADKWQAALDGTPYPDIEISSFVSWDEVAKWYSALQKPQVQVTPEIRAKAEGLTRNKKTDNEKIHAIYDDVSTRFRYIGISLGQGPYLPHLASDVLANGYGDCKDKHTLFAALLKAVGIDAYPVLIHSSIKLDADTPTPAIFDHVITAIPQGKSFLWLDTTPGAAPFGMLTANLRDRQALVVLDDGKSLLTKTPADSPFPSYEHFQLTAKLNTEGTLDGNARVEVRGDAELIFRLAFRNTSQSNWKDLVQAISTNMGFAGTVDDVAAAPPDDTTSPFWCSYSYHRPEFGDWPNHQITFPVPPLGLPRLTPKEEQDPGALLLGGNHEVIYEARITLPSGFGTIAPPPVTKNEDFAEYDAAYNFVGSVLEGTRKLHVFQHEVPAGKRLLFSSLYKVIDDDERRWIVLVGGRRSSGIHSENPEAQKLFDEGYESIQLGAPSGAVKAIEEAVKLDPNKSEGWVLLGNARLMNNQLDAGEAALRKAITLDPSNTRAYTIFGQPAHLSPSDSRCDPS